MEYDSEREAVLATICIMPLLALLGFALALMVELLGAVLVGVLIGLLLGSMAAYWILTRPY